MSEFKKLLSLDVNSKKEKKGKYDYLSWAFAWAEFKKVYPEALYEIIKDESGNPFFKSECGFMCHTKVSAEGLTYEMWLPIKDNYNKVISTPDAMDVNTTLMRCLVKNLAMFGLGLYIFAGEDLPEVQPESLDFDNNQNLKNALNNWRKKGVLFNEVVGKLKTKYSMSESDFNDVKAFYCEVSNDDISRFKELAAGEDYFSLYIFQNSYSPEQWSVLLNSFDNQKTIKKTRVGESIQRGREIFNSMVEAYKQYAQANDELGIKQTEEDLGERGIEMLNRRLKAIEV